MKGKTIFMYAFGALIILGVFALLIVLTQKDMPQGNRDLLNIVVGTLIGAFTNVVGYFFGSSKGSADKNELMFKNGNSPHPPDNPAIG